MKTNKIKQRIFAVILCLAMLITSVNLNNIFIFNAAVSDSLVMASDDDTGANKGYKGYTGYAQEKITKGQQALFCAGRWTDTRDIDTGYVRLLVIDPNGTVRINKQVYVNEGKWETKTYDKDCIINVYIDITGTWTCVAEASDIDPKCVDPCAYILYPEASTKANVTVRHNLQNSYESTSYTLYETQVISQPDGILCEIPTKSYTGYNTPETKSIVVNSNGSSVVDYYYTLKSYFITYNLDGGFQHQIQLLIILKLIHLH